MSFGGYRRGHQTNSSGVSSNGLGPAAIGYRTAGRSPSGLAPRTSYGQPYGRSSSPMRGGRMQHCWIDTRGSMPLKPLRPLAETRHIPGALDGRLPQIVGGQGRRDNRKATHNRRKKSRFSPRKFQQDHDDLYNSMYQGYSGSSRRRRRAKTQKRRRKKKRYNQFRDESMNDQYAQHDHTMLQYKIRDRNRLLAYLADRNCKLFSTADHVIAVSDDDLDALIVAGGNCDETLNYLHQYDAQNRKFHSFQELLAAVQESAIAAQQDPYDKPPVEEDDNNNLNSESKLAEPQIAGGDRGIADTSAGSWSPDKLDVAEETAVLASGRHLLRKDIITHSDPSLAFYIKTPSGDWDFIGQTEVVMNDHNPDWKSTINIRNEYARDRELKVVVFDVDNPDLIDDNDIMGQAFFNLSDYENANTPNFALPLESIQDGTALVDSFNSPCVIYLRSLNTDAPISDVTSVKRLIYCRDLPEVNQVYPVVYRKNPDTLQFELESKAEASSKIVNPDFQNAIVIERGPRIEQLRVALYETANPHDQRNSVPIAEAFFKNTDLDKKSLCLNLTRNGKAVTAGYGTPSTIWIQDEQSSVPELSEDPGAKTIVHISASVRHVPDAQQNGFSVGCQVWNYGDGRYKSAGRVTGGRGEHCDFESGDFKLTCYDKQKAKPVRFVFNDVRKKLVGFCEVEWDVLLDPTCAHQVEFLDAKSQPMLNDYSEAFVLQLRTAGSPPSKKPSEQGDSVEFSLKIAGRHLSSMDSLTQVFLQTPSEWTLIAETEELKANRHPEYCTEIELQRYTRVNPKVKFVVTNKDKTLGTAVTDMATLYAISEHGAPIRNFPLKIKGIQQKSSSNNFSELLVFNLATSELPAVIDLEDDFKEQEEKEDIKVFVSCRGLPDRDANSNSDPQVFVYDASDTKKENILAKTERVINDHDPDFKNSLTLGLYESKKAEELLWCIYDMDDDEEPKESNLVGTATCAWGDIQGMQEPISIELKKGTIYILYASHERPEKRFTLENTTTEVFQNAGEEDTSAAEAMAELRGNATQVDITLKCNNLPENDILGKSDPVIRVLAKYVDPVDEQFIQVGTTEILKDQSHPNFQTNISIDGYDKCDRTLRFEVFDDDDSGEADRFKDDNLLGNIEISLNKLRASPKPLTLSLIGKDGKQSKDATITISPTIPLKLSEQDEKLFLNARHLKLMLSANNVIKNDTLSKSDPCVVIHLRNNATNEFAYIGHTEKAKDNHDPVFRRPIIVDRPQQSQQAKFSIYDSDDGDRPEKGDMLGTCTINLIDLMASPNQTMTCSVLDNKNDVVDKSTITVKCLPYDKGFKVGKWFSFRCQDLPDCDATSKSDPLVVVKYLNENTGTWEEVGRTERIADNHAPDFVQNVVIQQWSKCETKLQFVVYDADDESGEDLEFLGSAQSTLSDVVEKKSFQLPLLTKDGSLANGSGCLIFVTDISDTLPLDANGRLNLGTVRKIPVTLQARNLPSSDTMSKSDPIACVWVADPRTGAWTEIGRTEVISDNHNPDWNDTVTIEHYSNQDIKLRVGVFDSDNDKDFTTDDLLGECEVQIHSLLRKRGAQQFALSKKGSPVGNAVLILELPVVEELSDFRSATGPTGMVTQNSFSVVARGLPINKSASVFAAIFSVVPKTQAEELMAKTEKQQGPNIDFNANLSLESFALRDRMIRVAILGASDKLIGEGYTSMNSMLQRKVPTSVPLSVDGFQIQGAYAILSPTTSHTMDFNVDDFIVGDEHTHYAIPKDDPGNETVFKVSLTCKKLPDCDLTSKSDPCVIILYQDHKTGKWLESGRTEIIQNDPNPNFEQPVEISHYSEVNQALKIIVVDADDEIIDLNEHRLGSITSLTANDLFEMKDETIYSLLNSEGKQIPDAEVRITRVIEVDKGKSSFHKISISCRDLMDRDATSQSDSIVKFWTQSITTGKFTELIGQTECIKDDHNPDFHDHINLELFELEDRLLRVAVYDVDDDETTSESHLLGDAYVSANRIIASQVPVSLRLCEGGFPLTKPYSSVTLWNAEVTHTSILNSQDFVVRRTVADKRRELQGIPVTIQARHLPSNDTTSKSDPIAVLYEYDPKSNHREILGRTEKLEDNHDPDFNRTVDIFYEGKNDETVIKCSVYDSDSGDTYRREDELGTVVLPIVDLLQRPGPQSFDLLKEGKKINAKIMLTIPIENCVGDLKSLGYVPITVAARNLPSADTFGKSDPVAALILVDDKLQDIQEVCHTEKINENHDPRFLTPLNVPYKEGQPDKLVKIAFYDSDASDGSHEAENLLGYHVLKVSDIICTAQPQEFRLLGTDGSVLKGEDGEAAVSILSCPPPCVVAKQKAPEKTLAVTIQARNLPSNDTFGESDPVAAIFACDPHTRAALDQIGHTEKINENRDPDFKTNISVTFSAESSLIKVAVYDCDKDDGSFTQDDLLGSCIVDMLDLDLKKQETYVLLDKEGKILDNNSHVVLSVPGAKKFVNDAVPSIPLTLCARGLPSADTIGKSDPIAGIYLLDSAMKPTKKLGQTEVIVDSHDPDFKTFIDVPGFKHGSDNADSVLYLGIYDSDDHKSYKKEDLLGFYIVSVSELVRKRQHHFPLLDKDNKWVKTNCTIIINLPAAFVQPKSNNAHIDVSVSIAAKGLPSSDTWGKSDPICAFYHCDNRANIPYQKFGQTEKIDNNHDPVFKTPISFAYQPGGDEFNIKVSIYDGDNDDASYSESDLLGSCLVNTSQLIKVGGAPQQYQLYDKDNSAVSNASVLLTVPATTVQQIKDAVTPKIEACKVSLTLGLRNLPAMDTDSHSDPLLAIFQVEDGKVTKMLGMTESQNNNNNPDFKRKVELDYDPANETSLRLAAYDVDNYPQPPTEQDLIGESYFSLSDLIPHLYKNVQFNLTKAAVAVTDEQGQNSHGLVIAGIVKPDGKKTSKKKSIQYLVYTKMCNLPSLDTTGHSDPLACFWSKDPATQQFTKQLGVTERLNDNPNPEFETPILVNYDPVSGTDLRIGVFDVDPGQPLTAKDLIGEAHVSMGSFIDKPAQWFEFKLSGGEIRNKGVSNATGGVRIVKLKDEVKEIFEYLNDSHLLEGDFEVKEADLRALLLSAGGVNGAKRGGDLLEGGGQSFTTMPALIKGMQHARAHPAPYKQAAQDYKATAAVLESKGRSLITGGMHVEVADVHKLAAAGREGIKSDTPTYLEVLIADGKSYATVDDLVKAIQQKRVAATLQEEEI